VLRAFDYEHEAGADWPLYSPDGRWIAFTRDPQLNRYTLFVMRADGRGVRRLAASSWGYPPIAWSPDGTLAFASGRDRNGRLCLIPDECEWQPEIYVTRPPTFALTRLTFNDMRDSEPRWTRDGRLIVFVTTRGCTYRGNRETRELLGEEEFRADIALTCDATEQTYAMRPDGSLQRPAVASKRVLEPPLPRRGVRVESSGRAHNGRTCREESGVRQCRWHGEIYVRFPDGRVRRLTRTNADETNPDLSPDAKYVVFVREGSIYRIGVDGRGEERLVER
jgi:Tol biopolymer transport system component